MTLKSKVCFQFMTDLPHPVDGETISYDSDSITDIAELKLKIKKELSLRCNDKDFEAEIVLAKRQNKGLVVIEDQNHFEELINEADRDASGALFAVLLKKRVCFVCPSENSIPCHFKKLLNIPIQPLKLIEATELLFTKFLNGTKTYLNEIVIEYLEQVRCFERLPSIANLVKKCLASNANNDTWNALIYIDLLMVPFYDKAGARNNMHLKVHSHWNCNQPILRRDSRGNQMWCKIDSVICDSIFYQSISGIEYGLVLFQESLDYSFDLDNPTAPSYLAKMLWQQHSNYRKQFDEARQRQKKPSDSTKKRRLFEDYDNVHNPDFQYDEALQNNMIIPIFCYEKNEFEVRILHAATEEPLKLELTVIAHFDLTKEDDLCNAMKAVWNVFYWVCRTQFLHKDFEVYHFDHLPSFDPIKNSGHAHNFYQRLESTKKLSLSSLYKLDKLQYPFVILPHSKNNTVKLLCHHRELEAQVVIKAGLIEDESLANECEINNIVKYLGISCIPLLESVELDSGIRILIFQNYSTAAIAVSEWFEFRVLCYQIFKILNRLHEAKIVHLNINVMAIKEWSSLNFVLCDYENSCNLLKQPASKWSELKKTDVRMFVSTLIQLSGNLKRGPFDVRFKDFIESLLSCEGELGPCIHHFFLSF